MDSLSSTSIAFIKPHVLTLLKALKVPNDRTDIKHVINNIKVHLYVKRSSCATYKSPDSKGRYH